MFIGCQDTVVWLQWISTVESHECYKMCVSPESEQTDKHTHTHSRMREMPYSVHWISSCFVDYGDNLQHSAITFFVFYLLTDGRSLL